MIENEVTSLKDMSVNELKELWRQYFCSSTFLFNFKSVSATSLLLLVKLFLTSIFIVSALINSFVRLKSLPAFISRENRNGQIGW